MEKILFRAKTQDGVWVYWNAYGELVAQSGKKHSRYAYHRMRNSISYYYYVHALKDSKLLIKETIGLFTGLTDRNGKKIFDGDILQGELYPFKSDTGDYNYFTVVLWFNDSRAFGICTHKNPKAKIRGIAHCNCETMADFYGTDWEVIGNIHDNSDLLEVK